MTVCVLRCDHYELNLLKKTINESLDHLGGLEAYVKKGDRVLLKTNLLMKKTPDEATTTHPTFVRAVAELLIEYGAQVLIGDSPGGPFLESRMKNIYRVTGMQETANVTGAALNFNLKSFTIDSRNSLLLNKIELTDMINDVDKIINLPKLKTHGLTVYTGAVKNLFGLIPGTSKAEYHVRMPEVNDFSNALIDICEHVRPVLHIMDGIIAMEGAGPSSGMPKKANIIIASDNPHDLDKVACDLIGLGVMDVPTLRGAFERGLTSGNLIDVDVKGDSLSELKIKDFAKAPSNSGRKRRIPKPIMALLMKQLKSKPTFNHSKCIGCGDCELNCPPKAIVMTDRKPEVDYNKCISCFCCQELCPAKAIDIKRPLLSKFIFR
ncbi:MAG: Iron-sulfur cluster-binding protein [Clostridiales bacterium 38_11]|nr:MAG: Iron-sulfur cluster-binding protein [Clostridiales bacterium 38_11]HBH13576.1 iron-sulfur protein [Clostridiales bacterium]